jgi:hypothetical protein
MAELIESLWASEGLMIVPLAVTLISSAGIAFLLCFLAALRRDRPAYRHRYVLSDQQQEHPGKRPGAARGGNSNLPQPEEDYDGQPPPPLAIHRVAIRRSLKEMARS